MKVSVVIPVKNGADTLERCLESLKQQSIGQELEIIVLDSMSTDGSKAIALNKGATIVEIPDGTFNHGLTRNIGVQHATTELIYFTVQDAWIQEKDMLEKMAQHFEIAEVMGVVGHQAVPHEKDKNPVVWFRRFSKPEVVIRRVDDADHFERAGTAYQQSLIAWDNVVAMYRRPALIEQPFVDTQFAEDWIWSRTALLRAWALVYDPSLVVYHYHHQSYGYAYKVAFAVNYHFHKFFHFKPGIPALLWPMLKATYHLALHPDLKVKEKIYWTFHNYLSKLGTFSSHVNFLFHLKTGGANSIEKRYQVVCKSVPQGKQKIGS